MQQTNFSDLTKGGRKSCAIKSAQEFDSRVSEALEKIERQLSWPAEQLEKFLRSEGKKEWKLGLREQFYDFTAKK